MLIRLRIQMSGTRNGQPWPARGQVIEVNDAEGAEMCASGIAEPVADVPIERATAPKPETREAITREAFGRPGKGSPR